MLQVRLPVLVNRSGRNTVPAAPSARPSERRSSAALQSFGELASDGAGWSVALGAGGTALGDAEPGTDGGADEALLAMVGNVGWAALPEPPPVHPATHRAT